MKKYGLLSMVGTAVVASTLTYLYIENEGNKDNNVSGDTNKNPNNSQKTTYAVTTVKAPTMNNNNSSSTINSAGSTINKTNYESNALDSEDDLDAFKVHRVFDFIT